MSKSIVEKLIIMLLIVTMIVGTAPAYALGTMENHDVNVDIRNNDINNAVEKPNESAGLPKEPTVNESPVSDKSILDELKVKHEEYINEMNTEYKEIVAQLENLNKKKSSDEKNTDIDNEILYLEELKKYTEELIETENNIFTDLENKLLGKITNPTVNDLEQKYTDKIKAVSNAIDLFDSKKTNATNQNEIEDRIKLLKQLKYNLGYEFNYIYFIDDVEDDNGDKISEIGYGLILNSCPADADLVNLDKEIEFSYLPVSYSIYPSNGYCLDYEFDNDLKIADLNAYDSIDVLEGIYRGYDGEDINTEDYNDIYYDEFSNENDFMYGYYPDDDYRDDEYFNYYDFGFDGQQPFYYDDDSVYGYYPPEDVNGYDYNEDEELSSDGFNDAVNAVFDYYENLTWELETQIDDIEFEISDAEEKIAELEKELETSKSNEKKSLIENKISLYNEKIISLTKIECLLMEQCNKCYEDLAAVLDIMFNDTYETENQTDVIAESDITNEKNPADNSSAETETKEADQKDTDKENEKVTADSPDDKKDDDSVKTEPKDNETTEENKKDEKKPKKDNAENDVEETYNNSNISWIEGYKDKINSGVEQLTTLKNLIVNEIIGKVSL